MAQQIQMADTGVNVHLLDPDVGDSLQDEQFVRKPRFTESPLFNNLVLLSYFALWYAFNIVYNISNKHVVNVVPLYYVVGTLQLLIGAVYVSIVWFLQIRPTPVLNRSEIMTLLPIAFFHALGHLGASVSLGAGAVSFTHIVKSAEPVFTSVLSALLLQQYFKWPVYVTLFPIIGGVAVASAKELDFSWMSFIGAMVSNVSMSSRAILSKKLMDQPIGHNMTPPNLFGVLTILALMMALPLTIAVEGWKTVSAYTEGLRESDESVSFVWSNALLSGITYYLYNEVAFLALSKVHPITHAVGNTIKRVIIIVVTCIVFGNTITTVGGIGCAIAIMGTFLYSLSKQMFS